MRSFKICVELTPRFVRKLLDIQNFGRKRDLGRFGTRLFRFLLIAAAGWEHVGFETNS